MGKRPARSSKVESASLPDAPPAPPRAPRLGELVGQERAVRLLRGAITSRRVHHAWIFGGPQGVGKRTAAIAFAGALLDPSTGAGLFGASADDADPDPESPVQRLIAAGTHPDLHVITKELAAYSSDKRTRDAKQITIPKQVIDDHLLGPIARAATLAPGGAACKVFIVDEAELLDRSRTHAPVQNAILKTLEEPPPGSVIILVTAQEDALLPTIRSRCQRVQFALLDDASMSRWLDQSDLEVAPTERAALLEFAAGSPGRAVLGSTTGLYRWINELAPLLDKAGAGRFSPELGPLMAKLVEDWAQAWVKQSPQASKEAANLAGARHLLSIIAERARRSLRDSAGDESASERCMALLDAVADAERFVGAHVTLAMAFEDLSVRLSEGTVDSAPAPGAR